MMTELQTLEGLDDAHRGAGFSCQLGYAERGHAIGVLQKLSSNSLLHHRRWPQLQQVHDGASDLSFIGALPGWRVLARHSTPSKTFHKVAGTLYHQTTDSAAPSGRKCLYDVDAGSEQSLVSSRPCPSSAADSLRGQSKVWSAAGPAQRPSSHGSSSLSTGTDSLHLLLDTSRKVCCASTQATSSWTSFSQFPLLRHHWRKGARLWRRVAFFLVSLVNSFFDACYLYGTYGWYRWDTQEYAADFFGEASASALTTTMDNANALGHRAAERWQCGALRCGRSSLRRAGQQVWSEAFPFFLVSFVFSWCLSKQVEDDKAHPGVSSNRRQSPFHRPCPREAVWSSSGT